MFQRTTTRWIRLRSVSLIILLLLPFRATPAQGLEAFAGISLGVVFNGLADRIDSSIQRAGAVADGVLIRAGSEANAAINNMRVAYADALNQTVDRLDQLGRTQLARIAAVADALERRTSEDMRFLAQMVTQGALILPFSNRFPQVTRWSPEFEVTPLSAGAAPQPQFGPMFDLRIDGVFPQSAGPGLAPTLEVKGNRLSASTNSTQSLVFNVPRTLLTAAANQRVAYSKVTLVVPFTERRGPVGLFGARRREARFNFGIVGLPASPGRVLVRLTKNVTVTDRIAVSTPQDNQQSDRDDKVEVHCGPNEAPNRIIDPNTVRFVVDRSEGRTWTHRLERRNNPSVCEWIRTEHHGLGTSDKVWFHFEYKVSVDRQESRTTEVRLDDLVWGDSRLVPLDGASSYVVIFEGFDGSHHEYASQTQGDRFIVVAPDGVGVRISARPVTEILAVAR